MFEIIKELNIASAQVYCVYFLILSRFFGAMMIFPLFNSSLITNFLKVVLSASFALIMLPIYINVKFDHSSLFMGMLLAKEVLIGALIGYVFSIPIWLVENVGNIIDIQRGEQFGAQVDPMTNNPTSSLSKLLNQTFAVYLVSAGGLLLFIKFILVSFASWSPVELFYNQKILKFATELFSDYFYWIIILSLPIIFVLFIIDLVLGLFSSFIQQLNVTVLAMPLKGIIAILVMIFYVEFICSFTVGKFLNGNIFAIFKI